MRRVDWSPLVVLLAAPLALFLASLLPDSFVLDERTSALILWVLITLAALRAIKAIRIKQMRESKRFDSLPEKGEKDS